MLDAVISHRIVKRDFFTGFDISYRNEIVRAGFIDMDSTIRVTGMIH